MFKKLIFITIFIGILIRIIGINVFPVGLNCDEASAAYDAYSILTTLRDRNNIFLPVYPLAWGMGQSALLMYVMLPFIKILGLNIIATRLPMAILSSISVIIFYQILRLSLDNNDSKKEYYILFGTLFFALNPWHIMKSRWGLDCNLLPDFMLFGVFFLVKFFKNNGKNNKDLILSYIFLSLSAYSYASAYLALAIFSVLVFVYGLNNHILNPKKILMIIILVFVITWPLMTLVIINFFGFDSVELPFMTIPKLNANRMANNTILSNSNFFLALCKNIYNSFKLYIFQYDTYYWNGLKGIGMYYMYSFPLAVVGIVANFKNKKNVVDDVFFIWLVAGFVCNLFHAEININRANVIIIPMIYFIIKGFYYLFALKIMRTISIILLLMSFAHFSFVYIDGNIKKENGVLIEGINDAFVDCFEVGLEPVLNYANNLNAKEKVFYSHLSETSAYIYVLYYLKVDPKHYYDTRKLYDESGAYMMVKSFDDWRFDRPDSLAMDKNHVYIFEKEILPIIDTNYFDVKEINDYIVVQYKG